MLSAMSPSSYIRRLHREFEWGGASRRQHQGYSSSSTRQEYRFSSDGYVHRTAPIPPPAGGALGVADPFDAFGMFPAAPFNVDAGGGRRAQRNRGRGLTAAWNAAGLTMETALEIAESDDDDDDVVEVIDVEALI